MARYQVKDYVLLKQVGRGARSYIYRAQHVASGEIRAIKIVPRKSRADDKFVAQVINEYEVGSRLDHPGITKYYALQKVRRLFSPSQCNLIMEYADGTALEKLQGAPLSELLPILIKVGDALGYVHEQGYVHSDFKPHNVIVSPKGEAVKLFDFGLACPKGTSRERIQGTIDFIAPEQAGRGYVDNLTDIYCFGATMYYLFTGRNIPSSLILFKKSASSLRKDIERITDLNPDVPAPLEELTMRSLERKKGNRPGSMKEITDHLEIICEKLKPQRV